MMSESDKSNHQMTEQVLRKYVKAMEAVYGPFDTSTRASDWTPPPMAEGHRGRYLWTDAFGVLNFLTLAMTTSEPRYATLATRLIDTVHNTLGRTRDLTQRLPGASDAHPLAGGLRIGKEDEEDDPSGDGDGQYHPYLTLWMFALNRMARATGERRYNDLAIELAKAIHPRFVRDRESARPRMYWKMSIDLRRPLVLSEGNLDPIDGYVVFSLMQEDKTALAREIDEYRRILETKWRRYVSEDPLDLGMTLWTAHWFAGKEEWATELLRKATVCLRALNDEERYFEAPTGFRLAFREYSTCLGVRCLVAPAPNDMSSDQERAYWNTLLDEVHEAWQSTIDSDPPLVPWELEPNTLVMYATALYLGAYQRGFFGDDW